MNGNKLVNIQAELFELSSITELNLGRNRIDRLDSVSLRPLEKSLKILSVDHNTRSLIIAG